MTKEEADREQAIAAYLRQESVSAIARKLGHSRVWVYKWIERYEARKEGEEWSADRSKRPQQNSRQLPAETVTAVKLMRQQLDAEGIFSGAQMIHWELGELGLSPMPSLRTIHRILRREGLTERRTGRYEPKGKIYPVLSAAAANEVHQSDFVGPRYLGKGVRFYSLNSVDIATGRCAVTPQLNKTAQATIDGFWANWCRLGMPEHQQVDNEMVFYGSHRHPRGMGCLIRLCLTHGIEPWFVPPREPWRNGVVEKFNDHYQQGFLRRVAIGRAEDLWPESVAYEQKHNSRYRYSKLHGLTPQQALGKQRREIRFPPSTEAPKHPLPRPERGRYHLVRLIPEDGKFDVFGEPFHAPSNAVYEYVTATIDVARQKLLLTLNHDVIDEHDYLIR